MVYGLSFGVQGSGIMFLGFGFRVLVLGFRVQACLARAVGQKAADQDPHRNRYAERHLPSQESVTVGSYLRLIDFCITQLYV